MNLDAAEVQRALAYIAGGGVLLRIADRLIKFHAATSVTPDTELTASLRTGAELREELRKEAERLRTERNELLDQVESQEGEVAALKLEIVALKAENEDLRAEIRLFRRGSSRRDDFEASEKRKRP